MSGVPTTINSLEVFIELQSYYIHDYSLLFERYIKINKEERNTSQIQRKPGRSFEVSSWWLCETCLVPPSQCIATCVQCCSPKRLTQALSVQSFYWALVMGACGAAWLTSLIHTPDHQRKSRCSLLITW